MTKVEAPPSGGTLSRPTARRRVRGPTRPRAGPLDRLTPSTGWLAIGRAAPPTKTLGERQDATVAVAERLCEVMEMNRVLAGSMRSLRALALARGWRVMRVARPLSARATAVER